MSKWTVRLFMFVMLNFSHRFGHSLCSDYSVSEWAYSLLLYVGNMSLAFYFGGGQNKVIGMSLG